MTTSECFGDSAMSYTAINALRSPVGTLFLLEKKKFTHRMYGPHPENWPLYLEKKSAALTCVYTIRFYFPCP